MHFPLIPVKKLFIIKNFNMKKISLNISKRFKDNIDYSLRLFLIFFCFIYSLLLTMLGYELISEIVRVDKDINRYERVMDYSSWSAELFTIIFMMSALLYPLISIISLYMIIVKINAIKERLSL